MNSRPTEQMKAHLRPTERELVSLPCRIRLPGEWTRAEAVLVAHKSAATGQDEAAVLLFVPASIDEGPRIVRAFKVDGQLRQSLDQTPPSPSTSKFHQSARPHLTLHLAYPSPGAAAELRLSASQAALVQRFIAEIKRLVDVSRDSLIPAAFSHAWLSLYPVDPSEEIDSDEEVGTPMTDVSDASFSSEATVTPSLEHRASFPLPMADSDESPNLFAHAFDRTRFLRRYVYRRQAEWAGTKNVKVRFATYNVNDKVPPSGTVELASLSGTGEEDILVLGLQEADLRSQSLFVSASSSRAEAWSSAFLAGLGPHAETYERVALKQYVGVVMLVWAKKALISGSSAEGEGDGVRDVGTAERGIGLLGFGGNKAASGVAVRMRVHDSVLCFVNSHLAAFATALDRRRSDYAALLTGLTFPLRSDAPDSQPQRGEDPLEPAEKEALFEFAPSGGTAPAAWGLGDSHVLFWGGDLNYRVDAEDAEIKDWVGRGEWAKLLEKDQLKADIRQGKSFAGFEEGEINFAPSFKFQTASSTYNASRSPAYTDRILFHCPPSAFSPSTAPDSASLSQPPTPAKPTAASSLSTGNAAQFTPDAKVRCTQYTSHPVMWSDHRPVSASFDLPVRTANHASRLKVLQDGIDRLRALERVWRPCLDVRLVPRANDGDVFQSAQRSSGIESGQAAQSRSGIDIDFGEVRYRQKETREVEIRNTGRVEVRWSWKEAMKGGSICKSVYHPFPSCGSVAPGRSERVRVSVWVDEEASRKVTLGEGDMYDVLVLQIEGAADMLLTLTSTLVPSIIAIPLPLIPLLGAAESDSEPEPDSGHPAGEPAVRNSTDSTATASTSAAPPPAAPLPICRTSLGARKAAAARYFSPPDSKDPYEAPERARGGVVREVWRLLEACMGAGEGAEGTSGPEPGREEDEKMWVWPDGREEEEALQADVLHIIRCLDTDSPLPTASPKPSLSLSLSLSGSRNPSPSGRRSLSLALLWLLMALPNPLVPPAVAPQCVQIGLAASYSSFGTRPAGAAGEGREEAFAILEGLEGAGTNVLIGLLSVVRLTATSPSSSSLSPVSAPAPEQAPAAVSSPVTELGAPIEPELGRRTAPGLEEEALGPAPSSSPSTSSSADPASSNLPSTVPLGAALDGPAPGVPDGVVRALVGAVFGPGANVGPQSAREKERRGKEGFVRILLDG